MKGTARGGRSESKPSPTQREDGDSSSLLFWAGGQSSPTNLGVRMGSKLSNRSRKKKRKAKEKKEQRKGFHPRLEDHAKESGFKNYASYLASTEWKDKRREVLCREEWRCSRCEGKANLQVHHIRYERLGGKRKKKRHAKKGLVTRRRSSRKTPKTKTLGEKGFVPAWEKPVGDAEWADDLVQRLRKA